MKTEGKVAETPRANVKTKTIKIAIVQDRDGYLTCCGPDDMGKGHNDPLDAAMSWHLEAGHLPAALYWVEVELPPIPTVPELRAKADAGEFPKTLIAEWDSPEPIITQHKYETGEPA